MGFQDYTKINNINLSKKSLNQDCQNLTKRHYLAAFLKNRRKKISLFSRIKIFEKILLESLKTNSPKIQY